MKNLTQRLFSVLFIGFLIVGGLLLSEKKIYGASIIHTWQDGTSITVNLFDDGSLTSSGSEAPSADIQLGGLGVYVIQGGVNIGTAPYDTLQNAYTANGYSLPTTTDVCFSRSGLGGCSSHSLDYRVFISNIGVSPANTNTRIDTTTPASGALLATSSIETLIGATGNLNTKDLTDTTKLRIHVENSAQSFTQSATVGDVFHAIHPISFDLTYPLLTATTYDFLASSTVALPLGKYYVTTKITKGNICLLGFCAYQSTIISTSTVFTVSTTTKGDAIKDTATSYIEALSNIASTTDFTSCAIGNFNLLLCGEDLITYSFVPTPDALEYFGTQAHDTVLTHFPIGYITDFISIMSTSTEGTLTPINATVPASLAGHGSHITLNLTHAFDFILNATSGPYTSPEASSTQTFFEITNYYWQIILYIGTAFYIISRILGSGMIPKIRGKINTKT